MSVFNDKLGLWSLENSLISALWLVLMLIDILKSLQDIKRLFWVVYLLESGGNIDGLKWIVDLVEDVKDILVIMFVSVVLLGKDTRQIDYLVWVVDRGKSI